MTVAFDAATESLQTGTEDPYTFDHTPVGTPRAVIVFVVHGNLSGDNIAGVTYGGETMARVDSVTEGGISEPGRTYAYFLGTAIPTGTQTVSVDLVSANDNDTWFVCITLTADADTEVVDFDSVGGFISNPQVTLAYGGEECLSLAGIFHGASAVTSLTPLSGMTPVHDHDFGVRVARVDRQTTAGTSDFTIGYTAATDEAALVALAVGEQSANIVTITGIGAVSVTGQMGAEATLPISGIGLVAFTGQGDAPAVEGTFEISGIGVVAVTGESTDSATGTIDISGVGNFQLKTASHPIYAPPLLRAAPRAGRVVHELIGPTGLVYHPTVARWLAEEAAPGGWVSGSGVISETVFNRYREIFQAGGQWFTYLEATGECISAGVLTEPDVSGGVMIAHKGRAIIAEREVGPVLYRRDGASTWVTFDSETFTQKREDVVSITGAPHDWTVDVSTTISWRYVKTNAFGTTGMPVALYAPGCTLSRLKFRLYLDGSAGDVRLTIEAFKRPGQLQTLGDFRIFDQVYSIPTKVDLDITLPQPATVNTVAEPSVVMIVPTVALPDQPSEDESPEFELELGLVQVYGDAGDELTPSGLVADIADRIGVRSAYVEATTYNMLPYEIEAGVPASDALDYASLLTGFYWRITGERPVLEFRDPRDRIWTLDSPHAEYDPIPQERFDTVVVPFLRSDGRTEDFTKVRLDPSPLERRSLYGRLELPQPAANEEVAERLGDEALKKLKRRRFAGDFRAATIRGEDGNHHSAHVIRAGDSLEAVRPGEGGVLPIATLTHSDDGVRGTFDGELHALERILERRARRQARRRFKRGK